MEEVMVVHRQSFHNRWFTGFKPADYCNFGKIMSSRYIWMNRNEADVNPCFKQPVVYTVVVNSAGKIFFYKRIKKNTETRLSETLSIGVGGHVARASWENNPSFEAEAIRELTEELQISWGELSNLDLKHLGYLNLDESLIDKTHFGIVYLILLNQEIILPHKSELSGVESYWMYSLEEIASNIRSKSLNVEQWSQILTSHLKNSHILSYA